MLDLPVIKTETVIRLYTKNTINESLQSTRIFMGDYCYDPLLDEVVKGSQGIERMSVLRADVDNLGLAFVSGFERENEDFAFRYRYVNLLRAAAFSRQMSLFFQYHINAILAGRDGRTHNRAIQSGSGDRRRVIVVYSGGDDIFLIGHWGDVVEAAIDIHEAFAAYTANTLTLSAGIGIFDVKYPVAKEAAETAELESASKEKPHKNAVTLFSVNGHTYSWQEFMESVIGQKLAALQSFFGQTDDVQERGNTFLYGLLELLRSSDDRINIARYAYLLARLEPNNASASVLSSYRRFATSMYGWIHGETDRRELITAVYLYIYLTRKRSVEE